MKVLVIDPGERVGFAVANIEDDGLVLVTYGAAPLRDFALKLGEVITDYDVVVYETWRLRANKAKVMIGSDFQPVQLIGMVRYLAWIHDVKLVSKEPGVKGAAAKAMPSWMRDLKDGASEEHPRDALDLLWSYVMSHHRGVWAACLKTD